MYSSLEMYSYLDPELVDITPARRNVRHEKIAFSQISETMDGLETARGIRVGSAERNLPVLVMTGTQGGNVYLQPAPV